MARRWLVTGCSTGLGRALVERLAGAGERVLATARKPETLADLAARFPDNLVTQALDVRDPDACAAVVAAAADRFGGVDVLVNNAGYGQVGVVEEVSDAELAEQFATNVYGPWRLTRLVLPLWRAQGGGHAVFVSSVAGLVPFPGLAAYTASKFALEGLAESLAQDTAHLGVKVTIVQPGGFSTEYGVTAPLPAARVSAYDPVAGPMLHGLRGMRDNPAINRPELFAEAVHRLADLPEPPLRLPVGEDAPQFISAALTARTKEFEEVTAARLHV
ncbi:SDR family oxidoreductase [Catellatospora bangladeshensis]|uniref:Short-chain dehydrogenase/reductase n=1 Tax=Catellatospora bangladeshensis TaxID=310355 RepID=A0A8J3JSH3_9ACTN|nr:SDR family oxidoreductase [Catellatospora bangladeshensis]GIF86107.1 short-chain dehydrogenase/reductase [Catellatospora bangladeshensis]